METKWICENCKYRQYAITDWCYNRAAKTARGTGIPDATECEFFAPNPVKVSFFERLFCKHQDIKLVKVGAWLPTFRTTNGLDNEDFRTLTCKCKCNKQIKVDQYKYGNTIMNHKELIDE